jgi:molybdenum cofactor cytidylyltransferase
LITLGDLPALTSAHFQQLIDACRRKPQSIIASAYNDSIGVPCIIPRALFAELETLSGDIGAKKVLKRHIQNVYQVPLPEAGFDIDTQDDLQRFNR